jgi:hypothetical protein
VLKGGVGCKDGIVRFDNGTRQLRGRVHAELELGFLAIIGRKTFKQECTETGTSSSTEGVENEEPLETRAIVSESS